MYYSKLQYSKVKAGDVMLFEEKKLQSNSQSSSTKIAGKCYRRWIWPEDKKPRQPAKVFRPENKKPRQPAKVFRPEDKKPRQPAKVFRPEDKKPRQPAKVFRPEDKKPWQPAKVFRPEHKKPPAASKSLQTGGTESQGWVTILFYPDLWCSVTVTPGSQQLPVVTSLKLRTV